MVWIHGGSFFNGSGGIYDARRLVARGDIVVVTINYRLGALGFLAHPALGPPGQVGNYGLADQQAALRWVRDNIAQFGGDPGKVTVAGESAGGMSVCDHLVAPGSQGLFDAAIIQSGPCRAQVALPEAEHISVDYARDAGCADPAAAAECLRALPADKLRKPVRYFRIGDDALSGPVTGTALLPKDPMVAFADGDAARVPVAIGSNRDEFTLFMALQYLRGVGTAARRIPEGAGRDVRSERGRGCRPLPAGPVRRQRAAGLRGSRDRRRVRLRGRAHRRRPRAQRAGVCLRVQRPAGTRPRSVAHRAIPGRRQPLTGAASTCSTSVTRHRSIPLSRCCPIR